MERTMINNREKRQEGEVERLWLSVKLVLVWVLQIFFQNYYLATVKPCKKGLIYIEVQYKGGECFLFCLFHFMFHCNPTVEFTHSPLPNCMQRFQGQLNAMSPLPQCNSTDQKKGAVPNHSRHSLKR